jgi:hypothetical protein
MLAMALGMDQLQTPLKRFRYVNVQMRGQMAHTRRMPIPADARHVDEIAIWQVCANLIYQLQWEKHESFGWRLFTQT